MEQLRRSIEGSAGKVMILPPDTPKGQLTLSWYLHLLPTAQARDIISRLLPEWCGKFLEANARYKRVGNDLGPKGIVPDINRKTGVVIDRLWFGGEDSGREPTREVIIDLIGHYFLLLHMLDADVEAVEESGPPPAPEQARAECGREHDHAPHAYEVPGQDNRKCNGLGQYRV